MGGACALAFLIQVTVQVEKRLCIHSFRISSRSIVCGAFLSYQLHCKCRKFGLSIGRTRNWPSRRPATLYECSFEQWARNFGRVMTRTTQPVPLGLQLHLGDEYIMLYYYSASDHRPLFCYCKKYV